MATPIYDQKTPGVCTVQYEVIERPPARVGQVFIVGNERTLDHVILRQVPEYPGQVLSYPDLRLAQKNLERLGIFKPGSVDVTAKDDPNNPDSEYKDIFVKVEEDNTGSLLFGVGVNSDAGLTGSIVLNERNFDITRFRPASTTCSAATPSAAPARSSASRPCPAPSCSATPPAWREPFLFDSPYSLERQRLLLRPRVQRGHGDRAAAAASPSAASSARPGRVSGSIRVEDVEHLQREPGRPGRLHERRWATTSWSASARRHLRHPRLVLRATEGSLLDVSFEECTGALHLPAGRTWRSTSTSRSTSGPTAAAGRCWPCAARSAGPARTRRSTSATSPAASKACAASSSAASARTSTASRSAATSCSSTAWSTRSR